MPELKHYKVNPETLKIEIEEVSRHRFAKFAMVVVAGALLFVGVLWLYVSVLGLDLPKTAILKRQNVGWAARLELMNAQIDQYDKVLGDLEDRDEQIYRSVYGMNGIPSAVRDAGFGGVNRYASLDGLDGRSELKKTVLRLDRLIKKAYIQSKSYDEVGEMARRAGDMASHIPAICPLSTAPGSFHLSSPFGYRNDPITGVSKFHSGMDFACPPGNTIYAVGDGVVESASSEFFGYGNIVIVNHGFGYKSRYAHMSRIAVHEGQRVTRGTVLGETGQSGRVTGPHLHYEIMYRDDFVNPYDFMDLDLSAKDYAEIIAQSTKNHEKE